jgi:hypothetical protein
MRSRHFALGCALAGILGLLTLPPAAAHAATTVSAVSATAAEDAAHAVRTSTLRDAVPAAAVAAPKARTALSISTTATTYDYSTMVVLNITLGRTQANRTVLIYASLVGLKLRLWTTCKVDSTGKLQRVFRLTRTSTFTVVYKGDARDAPATASRTVNAVARVADAISGSAKKTTIRGTTYYVFHTSNMLVLHATVSPKKRGECLKPETEQWDTGPGWDDDTAYSCDRLDSGSHDSAPFNLRQAVGDRYRIRADYVRGARDLANLSADGPWLYFLVVK